jgi:hypothetical protein
MSSVYRDRVETAVSCHAFASVEEPLRPHPDVAEFDESMERDRPRIEAQPASEAGEQARHPMRSCVERARQRRLAW